MGGTEYRCQITETDDIESYKPLIIKNIGAWKLYDGDGQKTYTAEDMDEYDNKRAPMAFQVWNPSYLGVSNKGWKSHSGDQYLISFASSGIMPGDEEPTVDPKNDDWLISPEIVGGSVLSFWSKEATNQYGAEEFEILTSSTNDNIESFTLLESDEVSSLEWSNSPINYQRMLNILLYVTSLPTSSDSYSMIFHIYQ